MEYKLSSSTDILEFYMAVYRFVLHLNNELVLNWHNSTLNGIVYMNTFNNTAIQLWNGTNQSVMPLFLKHIIKCMECRSVQNIF